MKIKKIIYLILIFKFIGVNSYTWAVKNNTNQQLDVSLGHAWIGGQVQTNTIQPCESSSNYVSGAETNGIKVGNNGWCNFPAIASGGNIDICQTADGKKYYAYFSNTVSGDYVFDVTNTTNGTINATPVAATNLCDSTYCFNAGQVCFPKIYNNTQNDIDFTLNYAIGYGSQRIFIPKGKFYNQCDVTTGYAGGIKNITLHGKNGDVLLNPSVSGLVQPCSIDSNINFCGTGIDANTQATIHSSSNGSGSCIDINYCSSPGCAACNFDSSESVFSRYYGGACDPNTQPTISSGSPNYVVYAGHGENNTVTLEAISCNNSDLITIGNQAKGNCQFINKYTLKCTGLGSTSLHNVFTQAQNSNFVIPANGYWNNTTVIPCGFENAYTKLPCYTQEQEEKKLANQKALEEKLQAQITAAQNTEGSSQFKSQSAQADQQFETALSLFSFGSEQSQVNASDNFTNALAANSCNCTFELAMLYGDGTCANCIEKTLESKCNLYTDTKMLLMPKYVKILVGTVTPETNCPASFAAQSNKSSYYFVNKYYNDLVFQLFVDQQINAYYTDSFADLSYTASYNYSNDIANKDLVPLYSKYINDSLFEPGSCENGACKLNPKNGFWNLSERSEAFKTYIVPIIQKLCPGCTLQ